MLQWKEAYNDLATREHNPLVSPQSRNVDASLFRLEVLHHGHALPAGNAVLRRQRVEPAIDAEVLVVVCAFTLEANSLRAEVTGGVGAVGAALGTSDSVTVTWREGGGTEDALEKVGPHEVGWWIADCDVEGLEGLVRVIFAVELVEDERAVALAGSTHADVVDLATVHEGIGALPVRSHFAVSLRKLGCPPVRRLEVFEGLEGWHQGLSVHQQVVTPELDVLEQPRHLDVETVVTDKDGCHDVVSVGSDLSVMEAEVTADVPVVEAQEFRGENDLDGVKERSVLGVSTLPPSVKTNDLEKVGLVGQVEDVLNVLGFVVDVDRVLLVAESIYVVLAKILLRRLEGWKC